MERDSSSMSSLSVLVVMTDLISLRALILAALGMELVMIVPFPRVHKFLVPGRSGY